MLAGGVGAARLLRGLRLHTEPRLLTVIVNTGDDEEFHGLHVSPDVDTVLYTLADVASTKHGWGLEGDTFACVDALSRYYADTWFRLGDRDLATNIFRTDMLRSGKTLTAVTQAIAGSLGIEQHVLPMSNDSVRTFVEVQRRGALPFQQYLVRDGGRGRVNSIRFRGIRRATPAPGVLAALENADVICLPPSNPFVSIQPILGLRGVRSALRARADQAVAVSPIIGRRPVKGPLHRMLSGLGHTVSPVAVARLYRGLVGAFVIDERDEKLAPQITDLGMRPIITDTLMSTPARAARVAASVVENFRIPSDDREHRDPRR